MSEPLILSGIVGFTRTELAGIASYPQFISLLGEKLEACGRLLSTALHEAMAVSIALPPPEAPAMEAETAAVLAGAVKKTRKARAPKTAL